jgi:hypothetical protein
MVSQPCRWLTLKAAPAGPPGRPVPRTRRERTTSAPPDTDTGIAIGKT